MLIDDIYNYLMLARSRKVGGSELAHVLTKIKAIMFMNNFLIQSKINTKSYVYKVF